MALYRNRKSGQVVEASQHDHPVRLDTPDGVMIAQVGDYVVWENDGTLSACPPALFESQYESFVENFQIQDIPQLVIE